MLWARVLLPRGPAHGRVEGEAVHVVDASPLDAEEPAATGEVVDLDAATLLPPTAPSKVLAVGRNYADHVAEMQVDTAASPSVFMKPPASLVGAGAAIVLPPARLSDHVEHEAELAVVIGRTARNVPADDALDHVFGYTCANDVSARDLQRTDTHITRAKGFDTFCPLGPWIATGLHPDRLAVRCRVNGEVRQDGSTAQMIFDVATLLASLSEWTTLLPGDVVLTGTPAGTTKLAPGDVVEVEIESIGVLRNPVAHEPEA